MENVQTSLLDVSLTIDTQSESYLRETAKWSKFLSILSFIFAGIIVLFGVFAGFGGLAMQSSALMPFAGMGIFIFIYVLVVGALTIIPNIYRYRFASQIVQALDANDQVSLTSGLGNLKAFYKFYGILMIVVLALYALIFIFGMLAAMMH